MTYANEQHEHLRAALVPLARLLIAQKISHNEFAEIAKAAYVEAAETAFALPNRKMTDSRISVLTGLSRKESRRIRHQNDHKTPAKYQANRAARVITGWLNDPLFTDKNRRPNCLPSRGECSFSALVSKYSGDITAGAILDELLNAGIVNVDDQNNVKLIKLGYIPDGDEQKKLGVLLQSTKDLLTCGSYNLCRKQNQPPQFQRQLSHRDVPPDVAEEFAQLCNDKSMQLLLELDNWLKTKKPPPPSHQTTPSLRVGLGIYQIKESDNGKGLERKVDRTV